MSDYDWFSKGAIEVATEGPLKEGSKWHGLADRMAKVLTESKNLSLKPTAFMADPNPVTTAALQSAYDTMHHFLNLLFGQAVDEFNRMGDALKKNADWYERAEADSVQNFDKIADGFRWNRALLNLPAVSIEGSRPCLGIRCRRRERPILERCSHRKFAAPSRRLLAH